MTGHGFTPDEQRYLDGSAHGDPSGAGRADADALLRAAAAYRDALPPLDARLDQAVLGAVRGRPRSARRGVRWTLDGRVRPIWIPLAAAAAALVVYLAGPRVPSPDAAPVAAVRAADTVFVQFRLAAPTARTAAVAGSFNDWDPASVPMTRAADGSWVVTLPLPLGEHRYQFVVDGTAWRPDPTAPAQVDDGFGGTNSVIVVGPKGLVRT
jgi:hypothetical protein